MRSPMFATQAVRRDGLLTATRRPAASVVSVLGVLVVLAGARNLSAQASSFQTSSFQAGPEESVRDPRDVRAHSLTVNLARGCISVSRQPGKPVHVSVRSDSGTFILVGDSAIVAQWADSAAALPDPPPVGAAPTKISFKMWQLRAQGDSGAHMRFARVPTVHGPDLALAVFNGAWGIVEYLGPQSAAVLDALRGITTTPAAADSGTTKSEPASGMAAAPSSRNRPDTGDVLPLRTADSTWRPKVAQASRLSGDHPAYPQSLVRAHIAGEVLLQFLVDTTGRAEMASVRLVRSTNPLFALACRNALREWTFAPAVVEGHKVRELVQQPFTFAMQRP